MEQIYSDSIYRFSDPIRFFKANDPYYFEVDNIPLKQLQENCLWLRDQVRKTSDKLLGVKRSDIDELRPYATGSDRVVRVKPGRYNARINDASLSRPLAYLNQIMGGAVGDVDAWEAALPNPGNFSNGANASLVDALNTFKSTLAQDAMGMNGLVERAFTWPVVNSDTAVNVSGVHMDPNASYLRYDINNNPGQGAWASPMVIANALVWMKSQNNAADAFLAPSFETTNTNSGWAKYPKTENLFIKRWRGISRIAVVDVAEELSIEVPPFDPNDFNYVDEVGDTITVDGVQNRIDLVFIYSKPIDTSAVQYLSNTQKKKITSPQLGIVRGAGIKTRFDSKPDAENMSWQDNPNFIEASPGDQANTSMGFTSTSANDIAYDVRGSFPAPDDVMNLAPLIQEQLESNAFELVGQSILPVAYVWVKTSGQVILSTDVIDIRPMFRTAELAYNERAGIGAAFPQLSLANPAVGKGQLDYELKRVHDKLQGQIDSWVDENTGTPQDSTNILATGYVFGGWNFGPEGVMFDFYQAQFGADQDNTNDTQEYIRQYIIGKFGYGGNAAQISIPSYPDWDQANWVGAQALADGGLYPNDYINTFFGTNGGNDASIVAGSFAEKTNPDGLTDAGTVPTRLKNFGNTESGSAAKSRAGFNYISKKIKFDRGSTPWLADYKVDVSLVNCLAQNSQGFAANEERPQGGSYFGHWVEKGFDEFTIYVAFITDDLNSRTGEEPRFPAPHSLTFTSGGKKKKTTNTLNVSERGGNRFSGFVVPVHDILYPDYLDNAPITQTNGLGYVGNPRIGKCTYPTIMWTFTGIPQNDVPYLYGNLNGTNPTIAIKTN
jgi:hypothetical protein